MLYFEKQLKLYNLFLKKYTINLNPYKFINQDILLQYNILQYVLEFLYL